MRLATLNLSLMPDTRDVSEMQAIAVQEMAKYLKVALGPAPS
jgi:hypothetical protein